MTQVTNTNREPNLDTEELNVTSILIDPDGVQHTAEIADAVDISSIQFSSDVDHDQTTNRTHAGDDLSPATLEATTSITDASGDTHTEELADRDGDDLTPNTVDIDSELGNPTYPTLSDVPTNLPEGTQVYVEDENALYVEDGT